jgi:hypothetical protein
MRLRFPHTIVIMVIEMRNRRLSAADQRTLAKQAVCALLANERWREARGLPLSAPDWRLLLALYEAELDGRALTAGEAGETAQVPLERTRAFVAGLEAEALLMSDAEGGLRLTRKACEALALWAYAFHPLPGFNPYRATAGAPPPEPPPEPPGSR